MRNGRAITDGRRAARSGLYDEWSLRDADRLPYLVRLAHEREQALCRNAAKAHAMARDLLVRSRAVRRAEAAEAAVADANLERTTRRLAEPVLPIVVRLGVVLGLAVASLPMNLLTLPDPLAWSVTLTVALVPYVAGVLHRPRTSAVLLPIWALAAASLGYLHAQALMHRLDPPVVLLFAGIQLVSGAVALLLGLGNEPTFSAHQRAVRAHALTRESTVPPDDVLLAAHWNVTREHAAAIWEQYEAAAAAYLDSLARTAGRPAMTEAAASAVPTRGRPDSWDLLTEAGHRS